MLLLLPRHYLLIAADADAARAAILDFSPFFAAY